MLWYGMVWYNMVWYGRVWHGVVGHGIVWKGMACLPDIVWVWYGMVWYGMVALYCAHCHANVLLAALLSLPVWPAPRAAKY